MTSPSSEILPLSFFERHENVIVFLMLALFLGFNVLTAPFSPDVWNDEISYSEPAATFAATGHFVSHAWGDQSGPVWTGNAPLHQLLLTGFIKIFGFDVRTVRGVNMLYYALAVFFLYQLVRRYDLVRKPGDRLLLLFVLLAGTGLVALYRNGRYDALGALIVIFWTWCSLQSRKKPAFLVGTFVSAILMPVASLNIAPFLMLCGLTSFCLWRWKTLFPLGVTGAGCILGMAIMQMVYAHFGVPHIFHEIMKASGGHDVSSDFILSVFKNPSYIAAIAVGCLLNFPLRREPFQQDLFLKKIALALLFVAFSLPLLMVIIAKYHIYYTWMAIIPGTVCGFMTLEFQSVPKRIRILALCLMLVATLPGFPRRCVRIAASWMQRRPDKVAATVRRNITPNDVVFVHEQTAIVYYALFPAVRESYWLKSPTNDSVKATINLVFWPETGREKQIHDFFGGEWQQADSVTLEPEKFNVIPQTSVQLVIYRRN
jgi:hypothetical protein